MSAAARTELPTERTNHPSGDRTISRVARKFGRNFRPFIGTFVLVLPPFNLNRSSTIIPRRLNDPTHAPRPVQVSFKTT